MKIADNITYFLSILYNFYGKALNEECNTICSEDDTDEETFDAPGISKSRSRQIKALFQIMFYNIHNGTKKTPLHSLISQVMYDTCKSATLIKSFNRFGLCTSYDELMRNHNDMAMHVKNSGEDDPFPINFSQSEFTIAAIDNFDHDEATLLGIGGSHDTVTVLFKEDIGTRSTKPNMYTTNIVHGPNAFHANLECQKLGEFYKPSKKIQLSDQYVDPYDSIPVDKNVLMEVRAKDAAWILARLDKKSDPSSFGILPQKQVMSSWSASNSIFGTERVRIKKRVAFSQSCHTL